MDIKIKTIPHEEQRYETVGDWVLKDGRLDKILVSDMGNEDYEFLVGIHEAIEAYLCTKRGITEQEINNFDIDYEDARESKGKASCGCRPTETSEPGHDTHAPYRNEHCFAEKIERMIAKKLKVNWQKYDEKVNSLSQT